MVAFTPGQTQIVNVGTASTGLAIDRDSPSVQFLNPAAPGGAVVFVAVGTGVQTATLSSYPLAAGTPQTIMKGVGADHVAAVVSTGTATLYVTTGAGGG